MTSSAFSTTELVAVAQTFPAAARILGELGAKLRDPLTHLSDICLIIKRDGSLAARIIRAANSPVFSPAEPISSLEQAATLVGFQEVLRLVGAVAAEQVSSGPVTAYGYTARQVRENALLVALLMEELSIPANEDGRTAYTIGLLRSLGKLSLAKLAETGPAIEVFDPARHLSLPAWEQSQFCLTANEAAATILTDWRFPHEIPKAIAEHYAPRGRNLPFTHLLHFAARLADTLGYGLPGESGLWVDTDEIYRKSGIDPRVSKRYIDRALVTFDRLGKAVR